MIRILLPVALLTVTGAAVAQSPNPNAAEGAAGGRDKMICKTFTETGSLVKKTKTCKTKVEWERERENLRTQNSSAGCGKTDGTC